MIPKGKIKERSFGNYAQRGLQKLPDDDKQHIFYTLDNLIKAAKLKAL